MNKKKREAIPIMKAQRRRSGLRKVARKSIRTRRARFGAYDESRFLNFGALTAQQKQSRNRANNLAEKAIFMINVIPIIRPDRALDGVDPESLKYTPKQFRENGFTTQISSNWSWDKLTESITTKFKEVARSGIYVNASYTMIELRLLHNGPRGSTVQTFSPTESLRSLYIQTGQKGYVELVAHWDNDAPYVTHKRNVDESSNDDSDEKKDFIARAEADAGRVLEEAKGIEKYIRTMIARFKPGGDLHPDGEKVNITLLERDVSAKMLGISTYRDSLVSINKSVGSLDPVQLSSQHNLAMNYILQMYNRKGELINIQDDIVDKAKKAEQETARREEARRAEEARRRAEEEKRRGEEAARAAAMAKETALRELRSSAGVQVACVQELLDSVRPVMVELGSKIERIRSINTKIQSLAGLDELKQRSREALNVAEQYLDKSLTEFTAAEHNFNQAISERDKLIGVDSTFDSDAFKLTKNCSFAKQNVNTIITGYQPKINEALAEVERIAADANQAAAAAQAKLEAEAQKAREAAELAEAKTRGDREFREMLLMVSKKIENAERELNDLNVPSQLQEIAAVKERLGDVATRHSNIASMPEMNSFLIAHADVMNRLKDIDALDLNGIVSKARAIRQEFDAERERLAAEVAAQAERAERERLAAEAAAQAEAAARAERERLVAEAVAQWDKCRNKAIRDALVIITSSELLDVQQQKLQYNEEEKVDIQDSKETAELRKINVILQDKANAPIAFNMEHDRKYVDENCAEVERFVKEMHEILNRRSTAAEATIHETAAPVGRWTGSNAHEQLGSQEMKMWMTQIIRAGLDEDLRLPSEYAHFKNKHDWVNALKTSDGRRNLFESLWGLINHLSDLIAENRSLVHVSSSGGEVSMETYQEFEKLVAWHVLDLIMSTVRFQMSLNFGREHPNEPIPNLVRNVTIGNGVYVYLIVKKVFLVLAVSCALYSYVFEPGNSAKNSFVQQMEQTGQATIHEVTFFHGSHHIPLVTFYTPEVAEKYESLGGMHWVQFASNQGVVNIELEVHKFITPRITKAFMDFFSGFEGTTWTRDETEDDDSEFADPFNLFPR